MGWLGTFVLLFLIIHLKNFWIPSRFGEMQEVTYDPGIQVHDLYGLMRDTFTGSGSLWIVILYLVGCLSLAYHLLHGFQSAWRSLGVSNTKYIRLINAIGIGFSIIVPLAFAMMPISMYFEWVQ